MTAKKRRANPYTQPIALRIVTGSDEVMKTESGTTIERQNDTTTQSVAPTSHLPKQEGREMPQTEQEVPKATTDKPEQEKATIEVRLYLTPTLDDKLNDLKQQYKRRTGGRRIKPNDIMRKLIEQATIEDLLR